MTALQALNFFKEVYMLHPQKPQKHQNDDATGATKRSYERPQLRVHGQVSTVTLATSADFGSGGFGP